VAAQFRGKRLTITGGGVMGLMTAYDADASFTVAWNAWPPDRRAAEKQKILDPGVSGGGHCPPC